MLTCSLPTFLLYRLSGCLGQNVGRLVEVKQVAERTRQCIERPLTDALPAQPVVFNESNNRGLIRQSVINEAVFRPGRDDEQRHAHAVSTASVCCRYRGIPSA